MFKSDRGAIFAVGLVAGIAVAFFFFVWAFPWFSNPTQGASYCNPNDPHCAEQYQNPDDPRFWIRPFHGWLFAEDSLAQWLMAGFGVLATGVSLWAVILLRDTLAATREAVRSADDAVVVTRQIGQAQVRAYLGFQITNGTVEPGKPVTFTMAVKNYGQTPALNTRVSSALVIRKRPWNWDRYEEPDGAKPAVAIHPGEPLQIVVDGFPPIIPTEWQIDLLRKDVTSIYCSASIFFEDIFGDPHETHFAFEFSGECFDGKPRISTQGNHSN